MTRIRRCLPHSLLLSVFYYLSSTEASLPELFFHSLSDPTFAFHLEWRVGVLLILVTLEPSSISSYPAYHQNRHNSIPQSISWQRVHLAVESNEPASIPLPPKESTWWLRSHQVTLCNHLNALCKARDPHLANRRSKR